MKKSKLIGLSILSVFLLCSLSYNPIIAGKLDSKSKEEIILIENRDCGCDQSIDLDFPVICSILLIIYWIFLDNLPFLFLAHIIILIAETLGGCPGIP